MPARPSFAVQNSQGHANKIFEIYTQFGHAPSKRFASHAIVHFVYSFDTPVHFMVVIQVKNK